MSDNKKANDWIRAAAGCTVADPPPQGGVDAGSGTGAPPPAKRDMNDMNEAIRKAAGRAKWN